MLKFPLIATEYYAFNSVPNVESKKLMTIMYEKWDKTEKGKMRNFLINYNLYRMMTIL